MCVCLSLVIGVYESKPEGCCSVFNFIVFISHSTCYSLSILFCALVVDGDLLLALHFHIIFRLEKMWTEEVQRKGKEGASLECVVWRFCRTRLMIGVAIYFIILLLGFLGPVSSFYFSHLLLFKMVMSLCWHFATVILYVGTESPSSELCFSCQIVFMRLLLTWLSSEEPVTTGLCWAVGLITCEFFRLIFNCALWCINYRCVCWKLFLICYV